MKAADGAKTFWDTECRREVPCSHRVISLWNRLIRVPILLSMTHDLGDALFAGLQKMPALSRRFSFEISWRNFRQKFHRSDNSDNFWWISLFCRLRKADHKAYSANSSKKTSFRKKSFNKKVLLSDVLPWSNFSEVQDATKKITNTCENILKTIFATSLADICFGEWFLR